MHALMAAFCLALVMAIFAVGAAGAGVLTEVAGLGWTAGVLAFTVPLAVAAAISAIRLWHRRRVGTAANEVPATL